MGLSGHLQDVSTAAPLPLLALAALASAVSSLFAATAASSTSALSSLGSGFAALVALADHLAASPRAPAGAGAGDCAVCLAAMCEGERVRALACRHAFHEACLDGWFDERRVSCPLCRAAPPLPEDVGRRAGEAAAAWFSSF